MIMVEVAVVAGKEKAFLSLLVTAHIKRFSFCAKERERK